MVEPGNIVPMEFKSNRWAGNIFDQLEQVFRTDMDELVNKDTLKFFENKVQSVGTSVKRLYSDVVQDIFPLSGEASEPEQQLAAGEQVDVQDGVSISSTRATSTWADEMQLANNHVSDYDKVRNSQLADVLEAQNMREQENGMVPDSEDSITAEKNVTTDLKPVTANSSIDGDIFSSEFDEDVFPSLAFSAHEEERRDLNQQKGDVVFSDNTIPPFDSPTAAWLCKSKSVEDQYLDLNGCLSSPPVPVLTEDHCSLMDSPLPLGCDVDDEVQEKYIALSESCSSDVNGSLSSPPVPVLTQYNCSLMDSPFPLGCDVDDEVQEKYKALSKSCSSDVNGSLYSPPVPVLTQDNCSLTDSPLPLACNVDDEVQEKYRALSKSCSTEDDSVDLSTSVQSSERVLPFFCDEKEETVAVMSSTYCTSPSSCMTTKSSCAEFSKEADDVLHSRGSGVSDCCTHDISAASSTKSLMMESNDNTLHTDRSEFLDGSFKIFHEEHFKKGHSEILMSPSESEFMYGLGARIGDLDLDNVDLSSNVKHDDGRSVNLYSKFPQPSSYRRKNFSYYKKLIHGAFTSRKRIAKEYEQLEIMYGDIDVESKQLFTQSSVSSFLNTPLHAEETQSSQEMSENDWQLL
ncbi:uncharacterized protein LOC121769078 [Salvia splendens]|nr:uncharacterized protein LOC121769078 [Salvia splendens]